MFSPEFTARCSELPQNAFADSDYVRVFREIDGGSPHTPQLIHQLGLSQEVCLLYAVYRNNSQQATKIYLSFSFHFGDKQLTPLMLAAINGNIGLIQLFLRYKTMRDQQGRTALIHAVLNKQWFVLELNMLKEEEPILDAVGLSFQDLKENK